MLVLSRQTDQTIVIGDNIEITVVSIRGDKVRIGINAPREITVHRKEIYEAIQKENADGADASADRPHGRAARVNGNRFSHDESRYEHR